MPRARLKAMLANAVQLVYDKSNFVVIDFGLRGSDAMLSLACFRERFGPS
ncbi:hypothetical protein AB0L70_06985 [Kribbella sp. NPDC051952]